MDYKKDITINKILEIFKKESQKIENLSAKELEKIVSLSKEQI